VGSAAPHHQHGTGLAAYPAFFTATHGRALQYLPSVRIATPQFLQDTDFAGGLALRAAFWHTTALQYRPPRRTTIPQAVHVVGVGVGLADHRCRLSRRSAVDDASTRLEHGAHGRSWES